MHTDEERIHISDKDTHEGNESDTTEDDERSREWKSSHYTKILVLTVPAHFQRSDVLVLSIFLFFWNLEIVGYLTSHNPEFVYIGPCSFMSLLMECGGLSHGPLYDLIKKKKGRLKSIS